MENISVARNPGQVGKNASQNFCVWDFYFLKLDILS
jgi:hypothetical protein